MERKTVVILVIIAILGLAGFGGWYLAGSREQPPGTPEPVTVAYSPFESTALFWIAVDQGFFEKNGINLSLREYPTGAGSLDGVINGEADMSVGATEFPLVAKAFQGTGIRALAVIDRGEFTYLVARKDRGIANISDLKGRRVGTTTGTVAEFHLGRFLALHGMDREDITIVDIRNPDGWVNEVARGNIDAIATAQPYAGQARDRLGDNAVSWPIQSSQPLFALVISRDNWIAAHPGTTARFLDALARAEEYAYNHPQESREILRKRLDLDPGYLDTVWEQNQFALTLDQSLVLAMEDEARWMIANNLTNATAVPDFRRHISPDALDRVRPGSVNIIR